MLEHEADAPLARSELDPSSGIEPWHTVARDMTCGRARQTRYDAQDRRLAASGRTDQREHFLRRALELDVEGNRALLAQPNFEPALSHAGELRRVSR
jgi:hypothetical protein